MAIGLLVNRKTFEKGAVPQRKTFSLRDGPVLYGIRIHFGVPFQVTQMVLKFSSCSYDEIYLGFRLHSA